MVLCIFLVVLVVLGVLGESSESSDSNDSSGSGDNNDSGGISDGGDNHDSSGSIDSSDIQNYVLSFTGQCDMTCSEHQNCVHWREVKRIKSYLQCVESVKSMAKTTQTFLPGPICYIRPLDDVLSNGLCGKGGDLTSHDRLKRSENYLLLDFLLVMPSQSVLLLVRQLVT